MEEITNQNEKSILEENLRLTKEIHEMTRKIHNYVIFQRILSVIYLFLIIIPLVLGAIYLPPLIREIFSPYQDLLQGNFFSPINSSTQDISDLINQAGAFVNENN